MAHNSTWSLYSNEITNEHLLFENLIIEFTDISGTEVYYYQIDPSNFDPLYGEDPNVPYYHRRVTKMLSPVFGSPDIINIFGMRDDIAVNDMYIPKAIFQRDISETKAPTVGDIIYIPWIDRTLEITWVDDKLDSGIFLNKSFSWQFSVRPFRYSKQNDTADTLALHPGPADTNTTSKPLSAFGENIFIESESEAIEDYTGIDTTIYGY
jgi:hypothetical protein